MGGVANSLHNFNSIKVRLKLYDRINIIIFQTLFQFHKGTIKTSDILAVPSPLDVFQFHKGTIKTPLGIVSFPLILIFQFHKGTIKTLVLTEHYLHQSHFNSIKVRLKLKQDLIEDYMTPLFQFHKGTIKTKLDAIPKGWIYRFQFHKGTIKTMKAWKNIMRFCLISIP